MEQAALVARASYGFTDSGAANHFLDQITVLVNMNLGFVRGAEKVVIIAHHFLICANQSKGEIIRLAGNQLVQFQHVLHVMQVDELVHHAV